VLRDVPGGLSLHGGLHRELLVPKSIDAPPAVVGILPALAINVGLLLAFGLQHSIMARPTFKKWWTRFVPAPRSAARTCWQATCA
jgi:hypothetical protein